MALRFRQERERPRRQEFETRQYPADGSYQLAGVFRPCWLGPVLQELIANGDFGTFEPGYPEGRKLIDMLPSAKDGFMLTNTLTMLLYIYVKQNQLIDPNNKQYVVSDRLMNDVFRGMPSLGFIERDEDNKQRKILWDQVEAEPKSTFELMESRYPDFDQTYFKSYYFQNMIQLNTLKESDAQSTPGYEDVAAALQNPSLRNQMLFEHQLVKMAQENWVRQENKNWPRRH